jgi:transposase-like protein
MPHKEKLKVQEKIDLIRRCQTGELGKTEASRIAGVDLKTIYHWLARYEAEGESGFMAYSRNRVYTPEAKLNAVRDYLSGKGSQLEICKKYKIRNTHCLRGWIKVYNAHGDFSSRKYSGGGSYMKQGRTTTQEERVQIAKECIASGKNYGEIAQKYQVSYQQVRTWTLRFEELGEAGLEDRRGGRKTRRRIQNWRKHRSRWSI